MKRAWARNSIVINLSNSFQSSASKSRLIAHLSVSYAFGGAATAAPAGAAAGRAAVSVAARMEWPLNWRVKLNSPSLCPTMFSVTYTGINFLPLCTAIVCPTISGITVERRDQVRTTFFSFREFIASTRLCR